MEVNSFFFQHLFSALKKMSSTIRQYYFAGGSSSHYCQVQSYSSAYSDVICRLGTIQQNCLQNERIITNLVARTSQMDYCML